MDNKDMPLCTLTVAQFEEILDSRIQAINYSNENLVTPEMPHLLRGVQELANFLGTSLSTAQRIKGTGILIPATIQSGRTCIFDSTKVLEVLQSRTAVIKYHHRKK